MQAAASKEEETKAGSNSTGFSPRRGEAKRAEVADRIGIARR